MGPTILFTHLKIILLQCFQFSVFSNNKLNPNGPIGTVCIPRFPRPRFLPLFFFLRVNSNLTWVHCSRTVQYCSCTVHVLKNIKNWSHDTIYTFKNYFATVFSVFSNNKLNPNRPYIVFHFFLSIWQHKKNQSMKNYLYSMKNPINIIFFFILYSRRKQLILAPTLSHTSKNRAWSCV